MVSQQGPVLSTSNDKTGKTLQGVVRELVRDANTIPKKRQERYKKDYPQASQHTSLSEESEKQHVRIKPCIITFWQ